MERRRIVVLVLALTALKAAAFTDTLVVDALWIGNSFTAKYVLPNSLRTMFRGAPDDTYISLRNTEKIEWGQTLKYHYQSTDAYQTLLDGDFDIVVLQDFPRTGGAGDAQDLAEYGGLFVDAALQKGVTPVVFWTWPSEANQDYLDDLIELYESFCADRDVMVAPANAAWRHVFDTDPSYPLYNDDALHQSQYGHYLNLCVFYSIFKEFSPEGNTYRVWGEFPSAPLTPIAVDTATYLQAQAWAVVDSMLGPFATSAADFSVAHTGAAQAVLRARVSVFTSATALPGRVFMLNGACAGPVHGRTLAPAGVVIRNDEPTY